MATLQAKAFIFDLDGTLIDTTPLVIRHWTEFAAEHGLDASEILATSHGRRTIETIAQWVPALATQEVVDRYERQLADETEGVTVLPGVKDLLANMPLDRYAVCTAGTMYMAKKRLEQCAIEVPATMATGDRVTRGKPDPEGYLMAAKGLGMPAKDCIVFEDAPAGVLAGKAAGMTTIACTTTHTLEQLATAGADYIVSSLEHVSVTKNEAGSFTVTVTHTLPTNEATHNAK